MKEESKKPRLIFLDNIKVLFAILVIFTHVRVSYGGEGWWYYISTLNESNPVDTFTIIFFYMIAGIGGIFQASLLGLFFLMGSYFTPKSYDRKGVLAFWKERLIRLGIPVLLYVLVVNPIIFYLLSAGGIQPWSSYPRLQTSFIEYYLSNFQSLEYFVNFLTEYTITWFLVALLIFTSIYTIWRQITKIDSIQRRIPKELSIPRYIYLLLLAICLGFLTFLIRINFSILDNPLGLPVAYMIQYFLMFSVGIIAYRYGWFEKMTRRHVKVWAITIFVAVMLFFTYFFVIAGADSDFSVFLGGFHLNALIFAVVDNIASMGMIFVLIKIFYAKFNKQGKILQNLADSSFHMYLIHPFVVIPLSLGIAFIPISPIIKLLIVLTLSVILCYLISHYVLQKIHLSKRKRITPNS
ncbi:MAG: acyltransferase family protein [Candidatus Lokiarchaeota archaeon]|nr:acyltransferase family protein [Candidatus Lokiarchaeota archaeon]